MLLSALILLSGSLSFSLRETLDGDGSLGNINIWKECFLLTEH